MNSLRRKCGHLSFVPVLELDDDEVRTLKNTRCEACQNGFPDIEPDEDKMKELQSKMSREAEND